MAEPMYYKVERSSELPTRPLIQVCLQSVGDQTSGSICETSALLLEQLAQGQDVPNDLRSQLPLFGHACDALGTLRKAAVFPKLTALALREARRNALILQDREFFLTTCDSLQLSVAEICGPMLGQRYYPGPNLRHTHALKFMLHDNRDQEALVALLMKQGWRRALFDKSADKWQVRVASPAGVEVKIYLKPLPHSDYSPPDVALDTVEFQVAMIICQSQFEPQERTLRWLCDLVFFFSKTPIDAALVAEMIKRYGLSGTSGNKLMQVQEMSTSIGANKAYQTATSILEAMAADGAMQNTPKATATLRYHSPRPRSLTQRAYFAAKRLIVAKAKRC